MAWPAIATILLAGYERGSDVGEERTPFEDGSARQATLYTRTYDTRRFDFVVKHSDVAEWNTWLKTNRTRFFSFTDVDDQQTRQVRIRGGAGTVTLTYVDGQRYKGERFWRGSVLLEGWW